MTVHVPVLCCDCLHLRLCAPIFSAKTASLSVASQYSGICPPGPPRLSQSAYRGRILPSSDCGHTAAVSTDVHAPIVSLCGVGIRRTTHCGQQHRIPHEDTPNVLLPALARLADPLILRP